MAREVYVSAPPASSVTVTIGQRAQMDGDRRTYTRSHAGPRRPLRTLRPETKGQAEPARIGRGPSLYSAGGNWAVNAQRDDQ
jgi:hypothetical protein